MNILVIGNGFDLAHNLPTTYEDFLKFTDEFIKCKTQYDSNGVLDLEEDDSNGGYREYFITLFNEWGRDINTGGLLVELNGLIQDNVWLKYFKNIKIKSGWIDFEKEISKIIQTLDRVKESRDIQIKQDPMRDSFILDKYDAAILKKIIIKSNKISIDGVEKIKEILLEDLNRLIRCLEIYLSDYVNKIQIVKKNPDIEKLKIDRVLSFNYTNTYERIYNLYGEKNIEYDFIHGEADLHKKVDTCNLVLGIDEYLSIDKKDSDNEFIQFKKFYQRIYKKTGCAYMDWIKNSDFVVQTDSMDLSDSGLHIYIFGHSLDVTDKDILSQLINTEGATTTIFYHNQRALGNLISNLVKVIGQDKLISSVHGADASIIFEEQRK